MVATVIPVKLDLEKAKKEGIMALLRFLDTCELFEANQIVNEEALRLGCASHTFYIEHEIGKDKTTLVGRNC